MPMCAGVIVECVYPNVEERNSVHIIEAARWHPVNCSLDQLSMQRRVIGVGRHLNLMEFHARDRRFRSSQVCFMSAMATTKNYHCDDGGFSFVVSHCFSRGICLFFFRAPPILTNVYVQNTLKTTITAGRWKCGLFCCGSVWLIVVRYASGSGGIAKMEDKRVLRGLLAHRATRSADGLPPGVSGDDGGSPGWNNRPVRGPRRSVKMATMRRRNLNECANRARSLQTKQPAGEALIVP